MRDCKSGFPQTWGVERLRSSTSVDGRYELIRERCELILKSRFLLGFQLTALRGRYERRASRTRVQTWEPGFTKKFDRAPGFGDVKDAVKGVLKVEKWKKHACSGAWLRNCIVKTGNKWWQFFNADFLKAVATQHSDHCIEKKATKRITVNSGQQTKKTWVKLGSWQHQQQQHHCHSSVAPKKITQKKEFTKQIGECLPPNNAMLVTTGMSEDHFLTLCCSDSTPTPAVDHTDGNNVQTKLHKHFIGT